MRVIPHEHEEEDLEISVIPSACIFDAQFLGEPVPEGFNAVRIVLDGKLNSDLSWKREREIALEYIGKGIRIFWEMDFGLLNPSHSVDNRTQFLAFSLSLEHFCNTLWKEFRRNSVGLCLYRGSLDISQVYLGDEEQKSNLQEMMGEYLYLLGSKIPDHLPLFLLFDAAEIGDPFTLIRLYHLMRFPRFHYGVKADPKGMAHQVLGGHLGWDGPVLERGFVGRETPTDLSPVEKPSLGFCLPYHQYDSAPLKQALELLWERKIAFRAIPESELASEWDGLDHLIVDSGAVDDLLKRKLQGFCAAGGCVVTIGSGLNLANEIPFKDLTGITGTTGTTEN